MSIGLSLVKSFWLLYNVPSHFLTSFGLLSKKKKHTFRIYVNLNVRGLHSSCSLLPFYFASFRVSENLYACFANTLKS